MDAIERAANISVARACGFCALAIVCFMAGFSYEPHLAARAGGLFSFAVTVGLVFKAMMAPRQPYKSTETWIMLPAADRPAPAIAQAVIGTTLRGVFLKYARYAAAVTVILLTAAVLLAVVFG